MQLSITFRHMDASDFLKNYAQEKVERVNRYLDRAGEAHVVLSLERHLHNADIQIHSGSFTLRGREKSEDMYASIDLAMDKIERQLKRYKDKLKNHHSKRFAHHQAVALKQMRVRHNVFELPDPSELEQQADGANAHDAQTVEADVPNLGSRIIKQNEFLARPMTVEEAVMQMDLANNDFWVFTNAESHEMNVVYRRDDGKYGLIEAHAAAK